MIFSRYLTPNSRILIYRGIQTARDEDSPWMTYDPPYAAIVDGRIIWIMDGYTSSDHYPTRSRLQTERTTFATP